MQRRTQPSLVEFVSLCAMLMGMVAFSIDIMLPALGDIITDLPIRHPNHRQWIILTVILGMFIGQFTFGTLSDSLGRRKTIFLGIGVYILGSLICALAPSFNVMLIGRLLQGLGASAPRVVIIAMISDRFTGKMMAKIMSLVIAVFIFVPMVAPSLGQMLIWIYPWQGLFVTLALWSLGLAIWMGVRQPETLAHPIPFQAASLIASIRKVFTNQRVMLYSVISVCMYGPMLGYVNASQQLLQDHYNTGDLFALYFGIASLFIALGSLVNHRLVRWFSIEGICLGAIVLQVVWSAGFLIFGSWQGGDLTLGQWNVFICLALLLCGCTYGNLSTLSLQPLGEIAGTAAAITASIGTFGVMIVSFIIGSRYNDTSIPMVQGFVVCSVVAMLLMIIAVHLERKHSLAHTKRSPSTLLDPSA